MVLPTHKQSISAFPILWTLAGKGGSLILVPKISEVWPSQGLTDADIPTKADVRIIIDTNG